MRKNTPKNRLFKKVLVRCATGLLTLALLLQSVAFGVAAVLDDTGLFKYNSASGSSSDKGGFNFDADEITEALKADIVKYIKEDLLQRVEDYDLSGDVGIILTFSENSLVNEYTEKYADKMTYEEYKVSDAAKALEAELSAGRQKILDQLLKDGLVFNVKHQYSHILDGAFVETTYESLEGICEVDGISRLTVSKSFLPMSAVTNPVDVYDTGIFNSGSVDYTGKGTIVAVLDTGCDYAHSAFTSYTVEAPRYSRDDIEKLLPGTVASTLTPGLEAREVYYGNLTGGKIAYGYDYADKDPDVMPFQESHGTHVAGIIAGKDDVITGVAVDAQLAIMKVFSDYKEGAKDGDIIAALEDCIVLGVDAINMSLGSSCGFSYESAADEIYKNELYGNIEKAGISLVVAASNDHSSGFGGEDGNTNKTDNPDSATVGSPSSYPASFTVASISGKKENYMLANGDDVVFFIQSYSTSAEEYDFFEMMGIKPGEKKTYEYVTVPGVGMAINYAGIDVKGKIALVQRGDITFEEKVQFAQEAGAIAVLIYNNVYGDITMTIGNHAKIPAVSIGKDEGERLAAREVGTFEFDLSNLAGPFMSDFSSWGPTPDLKLKPEITAHGGNINSAVVGGEYDELSGTSMAAPNMCGITVLIRQYVNQYDKENDLKMTDVEKRDLVNRLCMSTATIALDKKGHPYSPRKQGAGIADIRKATTAAAYILVDGIGKSKLELGDDPLRTGVYVMEFDVVNISSSAQSYRLGNITMTESISTSDPEYVAELAYLLSNSSEYKVVEGDGSITDGVLTVAANKSVTLKVTLTLSDEDKSYLDSTFENGMFVEGYLTFDNTNDSGVDLNAPFLAFYGNWGDAPIFDLDYYEVETEAHDDAIDDDDKIKADYYPTTPLGSYYYDYILPLGTYLYEMEEGETPIPATREHAAISFYKTSISGFYGVISGLLRGAKELNIKVVNTETGEVAFEQTEYNCPKAHYRGIPYGYMAKVDLQMLDTEKNELFAANNAHFEVTMSAKLDWNGGENVSDTYSFSFYVDYEAPTVVSSEFRTEYDKGREENRYYLDVMIYDNHYAMSCRPVLIYDFESDEEDVTRTFSSLTEYPVPVYQENKGETSKVTIEITDYIDIIKRSATPNGITLYLDDYALNSNVCYIPFPGTDDEDIKFSVPSVDLDINETEDLTKYFTHADGSALDELDYLQSFKWSSTDESVVIVKDGMIEALKEGTATVMVTSDLWVDYTYDGLDEKERPVYKTTPKYKEITVNVSSEVKDDDPKSGKNALIEDLLFSSYDTLFAFNGDVSRSKIGRTGSTNYFDGHYSVEFYPSEKIKLNYELQPWNLASDRYELTWSSSNPRVATVDENGVVTAQAEGKARITLQIKVDGKTSLLAARLTVEVLSEFIIENRELVAYKGWGGDVVIPDDEGILYIGSYAFSHFTLDNKKEVPKDEDGYYDMDDKKTPLGNDTVTSVVIPEGVETVEKHAFYNCSALKSVTLPESCKNIGASAFQKCEELVDVNFDHVKIIADYAFAGCKKLSCAGLEGGFASQGIYAVGEYAFGGTALTEAELLGLSRISRRAFADCLSLTTVILGERTRVSERMFENTAITTVTVHSDTIGDRAFKGCKALESVIIAGDLTYLGIEAFAECGALESVEVRGQLENIANKAFYNCDALAEFTLPNGSVAIGNNVFVGSGLTKLVFGPKTVVESFGTGVFPAGSFEIDVTASESYVVSGKAVYSNAGDVLVLVLPTASGNFTVPKDVTHIATGAFTSAKMVTSVDFEENSKLASIGESAFASCRNLAGINLPEGNEITVGDYAFYDAIGLSVIDLSGVTAVGAYAFNNTAIISVDIPSERVVIGEYAFANTSKLKSVKLGDLAVISASAFSRSAVETVDLAGDAVIGEKAFYSCQSLANFDFADVTGEIGEKAFYNCKTLTEIIAPNITAIGDGSFAGCTALTTLSADKLVSIGDGAFFDVSLDMETITTALTRIESIDLPMVESIGSYAFAFSNVLKSAKLPSLKSIGEMTFGMCQNLSEISFSEYLTEIPTRGFFGCIKLTDFDFTNIDRIGQQAFIYVVLPKNLVLENVTYIDRQAFAETMQHSLETVVAPKLIYVADEAFVGCEKLRSFSAPAIEHIGSYAFANTALVEFEIGEGFKEIGAAAFYNAEDFEEFFMVEDGVKVYDKSFAGGMIKDGVLYTKNARGYVLSSYPMAKADPVLYVAEGTTRVGENAACGNLSLETVIFPSSLRSIADFAFFGCENLENVTFSSYYAPTLEGTPSVAKGELEFITVENVDEFPGFDDLYKYNYMFYIDGWTGRNLFHSNFKAGIGSLKATKMNATIPENCFGYDGLAYKAYFNIVEDANSGVVAGKYAIAFEEAVYKLPENIDRFDRLLIEAAINAYNALAAHEDEKQFVSAETIAKFERARVLYNVNVVDGKIGRLFGMYNTEYCFNLLKDATEAYLALTDEEKEMVSSPETLDSKKAALALAMGVEDIDFSLSYSENLPTEELPPEPPVDDGPEGWVIALIFVASVVVAGGVGACLYFFVFRKKKVAEASAPVAEVTSEEENPDAKED